MSKSAEIINALVHYFDLNGWPQDVKSEKLHNRYHIVSEDTLPDWDVVEIERHRPILGTVYTPGQPMEAYETYYMRYGVHALNSDVKELPERCGQIQIDIAGVIESELSSGSFELSIEAVDGNRYMIRECVSNEAAIVSSPGQVKEFALSLADPFVDYFAETLNRELMDQGKIDRGENNKYLSEYEERMKAVVSEKAEEMWRDRESWDE